MALARQERHDSFAVEILEVLGPAFALVTISTSLFVFLVVNGFITKSPEPAHEEIRTSLVCAPPKPGSLPREILTTVTTVNGARRTSVQIGEPCVPVQ